jgi:hypothetical protein
LQEHNFDKNSLLIKTEAHCSSDSLNETGSYNFYFKNITSIPVIRLLSENALLTISQQPLLCNITLRISNSLSSEEIYFLKSVQITDSPQFSNLNLFENEAQDVIYETIKTSALPSGQIYHLKCTDFQKMFVSENETSWESLMASSPTDVSAWQSSQQLCRVLIKTEEQMFLSRPFQLFFNPQPLILEPQIRLLQTALGPISERTVLTLRVRNPNAYSVVFKVQDLDQSAFIFKAVTVAPAPNPAGYLSNERSSPLQWSYQPHLYPTVVQANNWSFTIPPHQEMELHATFRESLDCAFARTSGPGAFASRYHAGPTFVGLRFGFVFNTKFLTQISENSWFENSLSVGALAPLASESLPFWDLHFNEVKNFYGTFFFHPSTSNEEFIQTMIYSHVVDSCRAF